MKLPRSLSLLIDGRSRAGNVDFRFDPGFQQFLFEIELVVFELDILNRKVWAKTHIRCTGCRARPVRQHTAFGVGQCVVEIKPYRVPAAPVVETDLPKIGAQARFIPPAQIDIGELKGQRATGRHFG
jgi:hypothetical protein